MVHELTSQHGEFQTYRAPHDAIAPDLPTLILRLESSNQAFLYGYQQPHADEPLRN
jgi:hypothetical protein